MNASSKIGRKMKYLQASKERVRTCTDYVIGRAKDSNESRNLRSLFAKSS